MKKQLLFQLFLLPVLVFCQGNWSKVEFSNNPKSRMSALSFTCQNRVFLLGGEDSAFNTIEDFHELDLKLKSWKILKKNYPGRYANGQVAFVIDSFAYVGSGLNSNYGCLNTFYKYDVRKDTFYKIANLPGSARFEAVAFSANGFGYVGLGMDDLGTALADFYEYNPQKNTWKRIENFPGGPRYSAIGVSYNDIGIVGLGANSSQVNSKVFNDLYSYNAKIGVWKKLPDFNSGGRYENIAFNFQGVPFIGLGFLEGVGIDKKLYTFDSINENWDLIEINDDFLGFSSSAFVFDDMFIVGLGKKNNTEMNTNYYSFKKWGLKSNVLKTPQIQIFPNPASHNLVIISTNPIPTEDIKIFDIKGNKILDLEIHRIQDRIEINIENLVEGIYLIKIDDTTNKFIKS